MPSAFSGVVNEAGKEGFRKEELREGMSCGTVVARELMENEILLSDVHRAEGIAQVKITT